MGSRVGVASVREAVAGPVCVTLVARSREEELERAVEVLSGWLAGDEASVCLGSGGNPVDRAPMASHEIGVFYGVQDPGWGSAAIEGLMARMAEEAPSFWVTEPALLGVLRREGTPGIRIQPATFAGRAAYRAALLLWSDRFPLGTDPLAGAVWGRRVVVSTRIAPVGDQ